MTRNELIVKWYKKGESLEYISKATGVAKCTISQVATRNGLGRYKKVKMHEVARAKELLSEGYTHSEVIQEMGITLGRYNSIRHYL